MPDFTFRKMTTGPCLSLLGGAALFLFIAARVAAGPIPSPDDSLPFPFDTKDFDRVVENAGDWDHAWRLLDEKYSEPEIEIRWTFAGVGPEGYEAVFHDEHDWSSADWRAFPKNAVSGNRVRVNQLVSGKGPMAVFLRARFKLDEPRRLKMLFSAENFLAVFANGSQVYRGYTDSILREDGLEAEADFPAGTNTIHIVVGEILGPRDVLFRLASMGRYERDIKFQRALIGRFPEQGDRVVAAQQGVAGAFRYYIGDNSAAETEYRRLFLAARDDGTRRHALGSLAGIYAERGQHGWAADALLEVLKYFQEVPGEGYLRACTDAANAAAAVGYLPAAIRAQSSAVSGEGVEASLARISLGVLYGRYGLAERAAEVLAEVDAETLEKDGKAAFERGRELIRSIAPGHPFLDLNHTASSHIAAASRLAEGEEYDRAAAELIEALDAPGGLILERDGRTAGVSSEVAQMLRSSQALRVAYGRLAGDGSSANESGLAGILAARPLSSESRNALMRAAAHAASSGRYRLAALAARRLIDDYGGGPPEVMLAARSLAAAGDTAAARRLLESLPPTTGRTKLDSGVTLYDYLASWLDAQGEPEAPSVYDDKATRGQSEALELAWKVPVGAKGLSVAVGRTVRSYAPVPQVSGIVSGGTLYFFDGAAITALDVTTGREIFATPLPVPPGMRLMRPEDILKRQRGGANRAFFAPQATLSVGSGRAFATTHMIDRARGTVPRSAVAAVDASSGEVLWMVMAAAFGKNVRFISPPAFGHDRVFVVARSDGDVPAFHLACLDAKDGSPVFFSFLGSCFGPLGSTGSWLPVSFDPSLFCAAPTVDADGVLAVPNVGSMYSVDALSGLVSRVWLYPRSVLATPGEGVLAVLAGRPFKSGLKCDGLVSIAPHDTAEIFVIHDGELRTVEPPGVREVAAISGGTAALLSRTVYATDLVAGAEVWEAERLDGIVLPGGTVQGDALYVPTSEVLGVVRMGTGAIVKEHPWPDGVARGNLIAAGDIVLAFGESDVAAFRFTAAKAAASAPREVVSKAALPAVLPVSPVSLPGAWSAPSSPDAFVIEADGLPSAVLRNNGRAVALVSGQDMECWDVTAGPRLLWKARAPFEATGVVGADGVFVIYEDWALTALGATDGKVLWHHELPRTAAIEPVTMKAMTNLTADGGSIAYTQGRLLEILDVRTGEVRYSKHLPNDPISVDSGSGVVVVASLTWGRPMELRIFGSADGVLRAVRAVGETHDYGARVFVAQGSRVYTSCPNQALLECADAVTGRLIWRHKDTVPLKSLTQLEARGGLIAYSGHDARNEHRVSVLSAADGSLQLSKASPATVGFGEEGFYVVGADRWIGKYVPGGDNPRFNVPLETPDHNPLPLDWREDGQNLYVLLGDPGKDPGSPLSIAKLDVRTGKQEGHWPLALGKKFGSPPSFLSVAQGAFAVMGIEGVLRSSWAAACTEQPIALVGADGAASHIRFPGGLPAAVEMVETGDMVVDGDIADWREARWTDVKGPSGRNRARLSFASNDSSMLVAVRTLGPGSKSNADPWQCMRITAGVTRVDTNTPADVSLDILLDGDGLVTTFSAQGETDITRYAVPNGSGGVDYEISVDWTHVGERPSAGSGRVVRAGVSGFVSGEKAEWAWPSAVPFRPEFFGAVSNQKRED